MHCGRPSDGGVCLEAKFQARDVAHAKICNAVIYTVAAQMTGVAVVQPGDCLLGKFRVDRVIGKGATSIVVAARHEQLRTEVALKILAGNDNLAGASRSRFLREARSVASLRSEHIARVTDVDVDELGRQFLVMELLDGRDLAAVIRDEGPLSIERAVGFVVHACAGVAHTHAAGILHRDLKPANLFLTRGAEGEPLVKILDFGLATILDPGLRGLGAVTVEGALTGTPGYMSPEQLRAPETADSRADVWSLGVILFELLTGGRPFGGTTLPDVIASILSDDEPRSVTSARTDVPRGLAAVVAGCLQKDVGRRIPNATQLARALSPWTPLWADRAASCAQNLSLPSTSLARKMGSVARPRAHAKSTTAIAIGAAMLALATVPLMSHSARPVASERTIATGRSIASAEMLVASAAVQPSATVLSTLANAAPEPQEQEETFVKSTDRSPRPARARNPRSRLGRRQNGRSSMETALGDQPRDPLDGRM